MRRFLLMVALGLVACGGEAPPSLPGVWDSTSGAEALTLETAGRYQRVFLDSRLPEAGWWRMEPDGLLVQPDGTAEGAVLRWEQGEHWLRIWWPPHLLGEYTRQ